MSEAPVHPQSTAGYAAGDEYDKIRPSYPDDALEYIRDALGRKQGLKIVEVGCGTGKFTKSLLVNAQWNASIAELHCVEPVEGMLKALRETVHDPRVHTYQGTFDLSGIERSGFADLIVVATAFHWCLDYEAAMKEFLRLLKPDGNMCFVWNMEDRQTATWLEDFMQVAEANRDAEHKSHSVASAEQWRATFDLPLYRENFGSPIETTFRFVTASTFDNVWARCKTWSAVGAMPDETKGRMKEELEKIIQKGNNVVYVDKGAGILEVPSIVPVVIMKRKNQV